MIFLAVSVANIPCQSEIEMSLPCINERPASIIVPFGKLLKPAISPIHLPSLSTIPFTASFQTISLSFGISISSNNSCPIGII
ncbi:MAG: hypothetical protein ABJB76_09540 [Candidatus Nitrosocosmicus sp.]